jgi:serine O-acetyltransferase
MKSKNEYHYYIERDRVALGIHRRRPRVFGDEIWKFERALRKMEYLMSCHPPFYRIRLLFVRYYKHKLSLLCGGFQIPCGVFKEGLAIVHFGSIVVSSGAHVGKNCRIHEGVTIGATNHSSVAATIGDNCFIGSGAKIIGEITIGDNVAVGAGAVVVHSCDNDVTIAGVPAKVVSHNTSIMNLNEDLFI